MKRGVRLALGWGFVAFGAAGLVLPILQGILFLAIGLGLLAPESAWAQRRLADLRRRFPESAKTFDRASDRVARLLGQKGSERRR